jgi:hypothetical protein
MTLTESKRKYKDFFSELDQIIGLKINLEWLNISQGRCEMIPWQPEQGIQAVIEMPESIFIIILIFLGACVATYIFYWIFRLLFWIFRMEA